MTRLSFNIFANKPSCNIWQRLEYVRFLLIRFLVPESLHFLRVQYKLLHSWSSLIFGCTYGFLNLLKFSKWKIRFVDGWTNFIYNIRKSFLIIFCFSPLTVVLTVIVLINVNCAYFVYDCGKHFWIMNMQSGDEY